VYGGSQSLTACDLNSDQNSRKTGVHIKNAVLACGIVVTMTSSAAAQIVEPDSSRARVQLGPVMLNPTIELTNFGIDSNVFNQPAGQEQSDFTFTLTPKSDVWMKVGRVWLTGTLREDILWYQKYTSERAGNTFTKGAIIAPLNRVSFSVGGSLANVQDRPGFEIDARAQRDERQVNGSAEFRALARTLIGVQGYRQAVKFDQNATFLGSNLAIELNRVSTSGAISVRHEVTPLTSISFDLGRVQDRFETNRLRDSDSTTAGLQVTLDPAAVIRGSARLGYRDFEPESHDVPAYQGATVAVNLGYVLLGTTKFDFTASRDVQYSFDVDQPYYLQTGFGASIAQQIFGPVDVVAALSRYNLDYRERLGTTVPLTGGTDKVRSYRGGVGYHFGRDLRVGVTVEKQRRISDLPFRAFNGLRIGGSLTYGV
jgi:Putative beta-barrel porin 2